VPQRAPANFSTRAVSILLLPHTSCISLSTILWNVNFIMCTWSLSYPRCHVSNGIDFEWTLITSLDVGLSRAYFIWRTHTWHYFIGLSKIKTVDSAQPRNRSDPFPRERWGLGTRLLLRWWFWSTTTHWGIQRVNDVETRITGFCSHLPMGEHLIGSLCNTLNINFCGFWLVVLLQGQNVFLQARYPHCLHLFHVRLKTRNSICVPTNAMLFVTIIGYMP